MDIKRYQVTQNWGDIEAVLEVDHGKLTPQFTTEINQFWIFAEERLDAADDDVVLAVVRLAAAHFMDSGLRGEGVEDAQQNLDRSEGWICDHGIKLLSFDGFPDIDSTELLVEEIKA